MLTYPTTRLALATPGFAAAVLGAILLAAPAQASYISANVNAHLGPTACGATVGETIFPFNTCPAVNGPVSVEPGSKAYTDFGVNKVYAGGSDQATSEWSVEYTVSGAPGEQVNLILEIGYDLNIAAAFEAGFRMVLNYDYFSPFTISINTHGFSPNRCDDIGNTGPCMSGPHSGAWTPMVQAIAGQVNRLTLSVSGSVFGGGWVDAYNTVTMNRIIVPDGTTWSYQNLSGNPLNFQYANDTSVPEPAAAHLLAAGVAMAIIARRRLSRKGV